MSSRTTGNPNPYAPPGRLPRSSGAVERAAGWGMALLSAAACLLPRFTLALCDSASGTTLCPPTGNATTSQFVEEAIHAFVLLALPVLAFFIVLAGFNFVLARGNPEKLKSAKWNFLYVIIGTSLILGAWVLANLIRATVVSITS